MGESTVDLSFAKRVYENACRTNQPLPDFNTFFEAASVWPKTQLTELVLLDQHYRWRRKTPRSAKEYFSQFPVLAADEQLAVRILVEEFGYREAAGESPSLEDYAAQFPLLNAALREHFDFTTDAQGAGNFPGISMSGQTSNKQQWQSLQEVQVGQQIGPYRVERRLGQGAFGEVWLAERQGALATTKVALKLPLPTPHLMSVIRNEAQTWVRASGHPNIVPMLDADIYDGRVIIASEFIADGSLQDLLGHRGGELLPPLEAVELVIGVLLGLEHLHGRGIVHRDLKPANILLQEGFARLTDFGLSRSLNDVENSGSLSGTPAYMAPEAFNGERTASTDLWSVAVILFQLLFGRTPFESYQFLDLVRTIGDSTPVHVPEGVPKSLQGFLKIALRKPATDRFQSAAEMRAKLAAIGRMLRTESSGQNTTEGKYQTIAITGSMRANRNRVQAALQNQLRPFFGRHTQWYVGTWGVVDEAAVEILIANDQQLLLVGYEQGDVSASMRELIDRHNLTFVDAHGLTSPDLGETIPGAKALMERDAYFVSKSDLIVLAWDGDSHGTKNLLNWLMTHRKDHLLAFV